MNIGCVIHKKNIQNGSLLADWCIEDSIKEKGTGTAIGKPGTEYSGKYEIIYTDEDGHVSNPYDLLIENDNGFYTLRWFQNQELKYVGTGMVCDKSLVAGWKGI